MSDNQQNHQQNTDFGRTGESAQKNKVARTVISVMCALVLVVAVFFAGWFAQYFSVDSRARTLLWLIDKIDDNYETEITEEEWNQLYDKLYNTVLPNDGFCTFYTPEEYKTLVGESNGNNKDSGLSAVDEGDALRVYNVIGNSPAAIAGLKSGMYIYRFGTAEDNLQEGNRKDLYATKGNPIYLECGYGEEDKKVYTIESKKYLASYCSYRDSETSFDFRTDSNGKLAPVDTANPLTALDSKTAYLSLSQFDGNADDEFVALLKIMKERGRENLVLDLRRNGGGYLSTFQSISAHLLRNAEGSKPLVATAKYRGGKTTRFQAYGNDFAAYFTSSSRVCVLADERSASASECLIGALVDYGTVGFSDIYLRKSEDGTARSYGKGVMQTTFVAPDGSAARITTAKIYWPVSERNIHGTGVTEQLGATGISAPLLPGVTDVMLEEVIARIS